MPPVIASEAKQSSRRLAPLDCFVAALLAMTVGVFVSPKPRPAPSPAASAPGCAGRGRPPG
ncbi:MAG: hypothetical protein C0420_02985, partial [Methylobacterium sp.]|nr:hypothetical protein [Methylobacterium sp.]